MKIALIAHDKKKAEMIDFVKDNEVLFSKQELYGTGTTGKLIMENTNLKVTRFLSGPYGGDQQIGNLVALGQMDMVIFFRDPLTAQPHEPDINALMRLCDVHYVPLASNKATALMLLKSIKFLPFLVELLLFYFDSFNWTTFSCFFSCINIVFAYYCC